MFFKQQTIMLAFCYLTAISKGLTIRELSSEDELVATTASSVTESGYRKSVAKIKENHYRVPEHLQFVPKGFIYEDADDVIHVIDPPKHFEELKKIMQRQQQHQVQNLRPIALREQRPRPKIVKTSLQDKFKGDPPMQRKPPVELDMQTQETQHLPLEILASVRKTENYLRKYKPKLPLAKQRLKTQKIHTVIWEQQQEQQQYQEGQEHRVQGIREQATNRRHFNKKRFKRETANQEHRALKGERLLDHLKELINNASIYLKQTESYDEYPDTDFDSTTLQGEIFEADFDSTTLQGEVFVEATKTPLSTAPLNEDMVVKILENSVKATNVIMQQIQSKTNSTAKCDYLKVTYPNHIQNLQNQIKCMQNFIKDINSKQQLKEQQIAQELIEQHGEAFKSRKTKDLKHKPFLVAQLAEDYIDDEEPTPVNSSIIYDDVMATIRNMLLSQNLQTLEEPEDSVTSSWKDTFLDSTLAHDQSAEPVDLHNLHEYLTSLEAIVTNLPKFNHKSLNLQEVEGGSTSKYYFINPQGTIYSLPQPFQKDITTTAPAAIFHQFPDLPIIAEYLTNGTLLPPSSKVIEIL